MAENEGHEPTGLWARIEARLAVLKITEREASRRAGLGLSFVNDIRRGKAKRPSVAHLEKLAAALGVSLDHLVRGEEEDSRAHSAEGRSFAPPGFSNAQQTPRLIDLLTADGLSDGWLAPAREVDKVPVIPALQHVREGYAWAIPNQKMEPRYLAGEVAYVHPGLIARVGDFVLVRTTDGRAGAARFLGSDNGACRFGLLNPAEEVSLPKAEVASIHRIVASVQ